MQSLKQILIKDDIKNNIKNNLFLSNEEVEAAIDTVLKSDKSNVISTKAVRGGKVVQFENTLHEDVDKQLYLLESRLFDEEHDQMIGVFLGIFNSEGIPFDEYVDDVWEFANWQPAKIA